MSHVFICYHRDDSDFAEILRAKIEHADFSVWMDDKLRAGEDWRAEIDQAIRDAFALIVLMTPEAKLSEYVTYEWGFAVGAAVKVLPILLKPTELHPRLEALQYLDFTNRQVRPWDRLIEELKRAAQAHPSTTIYLSRDAPAAVKRAVEALDSVDAAERKVAIETLDKMDHPAARQALAGAVRHPTQDVRVHAAGVIDGPKHAQATPSLIAMLREKDDQIWHTAIGALVRIGEPAIPDLIEALNNEQEPVRRGARVVLARIGPLATPGLLKALWNENPKVRGLAAEGLGEIKTREAIPGLLVALSDKDPQVCSSAAWALGEIKSIEAIPGLREALGRRDEDVRRAVIHALKRIGTPEALAAIEESQRGGGR